jgi:hypothetical protein
MLFEIVASAFPPPLSLRRTEELRGAMTMTMMRGQQSEEPDLHEGAVEGDRPDDVQNSNTNAPALDENGLPSDETKICEDVLGANLDKTQG